MSTIALLVTLGLSAWLISRDCRRSRRVSSAMWIPTILLMILASRPVSLWASGGRVVVNEMGNEVAGSVLDQLFFLIVLGSSLLVASYRRARWSRLLSFNVAIFVFYAYFLVSALWSGDPDGSLKRVCKDCGLLSVGMLIFTEQEPLLAIKSIYFRCAALLIPLSAVFIKYFPEYARTYSVAGEVTVTGVTTQKNSLGEIVLVFTLVLVWDCLDRIRQGSRIRWAKLPWDRVGLILVGLWLLHMCQSKTALLCTVTGVLLMARTGRLRSKAANRAVLVSAISLPFLLFFSRQFSSVIAPIVQAMGRNMTFTGRTDIWDHVTLNTVNPLIGAGFWNFWGGPDGYAISLAMHTPVPNAHCGYVDMYIDGGFIGIAILSILLLLSGLHICKTMESGPDTNGFQRVRLAFLVAAIIYNLSESTFGRIGPIWFSTLLMIVDYPIRRTTRPLLAHKPVQIRRNKTSVAECCPGQ